MDDLISRQAAIEEIERWLGYIDDDMVRRMQIGMKRLPSAQPKRIKGRWKYSWYDDESGFDESWTCDQCGYMTNIEETNYCPKCGAEMEVTT